MGTLLDRPCFIVSHFLVGQISKYAPVYGRQEGAIGRSGRSTSRCYITHRANFFRDVIFWLDVEWEMVP